MKVLDAPTLTKIAKRNASGQERDFCRDFQFSKCPYCNDSQFLAVRPEWVKAGHIPTDTNPADYFQPHRSSELAHIPCDCHSGQMGTGDSEKAVVRFFGRFGERLETHWYGKGLIAARRAQIRALHLNKEQFERNAQPEAPHWHDDGIPDPPEHDYFAELEECPI